MAPPTTQPRRVFLAHAREDKERVRALYKQIKQRGFSPWLDEEDLIPGQIWATEIQKAIRDAGAFIACLSQISAQKQGYVYTEFRLALTAYGERPPGTIYFIPVRLDECEIPDLQIPNQGLSIRDLHWLDLWQEGGFERLIQALEKGLSITANLQQADEARKRAEAEARQAAKEKQREAERVADHKNDARRRQWLRWMTGIGLVVLVGFTGVMVWQQWSTQEQLGPAETQTPKGKPPPIDASESSRVPSIHEPPQPEPEPNHDPPFQPVKTFRDCDVCPEMVVVPAGEFHMGAKMGPSIEKPQRQVVVPRPLAIGRYEVTRTEWNHCVNESGCVRPVDAEAASGDHPITHISWHDAESYVNWLADKTGQPYRLLSEAEWEYAARAGATTNYSLGGMITPDQATFGTHDGPSKVGAHAANAFGLFDVQGNVWEWVEDCRSEYTHLGSASEASTSGDCKLRALRGGAYDSSGDALRASNRYFRLADTRAANIGFRIARELADEKGIGRD